MSGRSPFVIASAAKQSGGDGGEFTLSLEFILSTTEGKGHARDDGHPGAAPSSYRCGCLLSATGASSVEASGASVSSMSWKFRAYSLE